MGAIDTLISIAVIITFVAFVGAKIYSHEKEHLDPLIKKIKGWFERDPDGDTPLGPQDDFEIAFKGQMG
ncbi:hypothetical protein LCGC14_2671900 [marine sediment metagenome]|uniref:Uncharacterized protein n=1 Tax=marine sediment metagenome TaxID=412755 RepID=A0A0F9ABA5_9ZZZZ